MEDLDRKLKDANITDLLSDINRKYQRKRELAEQAWKAEQPSEDITTDSGYFHKTKVKKYPILAALEYAHAKFENNKLTELTVNGEKFYMYRTKSEYNKETEYTRPDSYSDFLKLNNILEQDITPELYNEISGKLNLLNADIEKKIEEYKKELSDLKIHTYNYYGMISQNNTNFYTYSPKTRR